jgi:DNA-binding NtrC family response regulator
VIFSCGVSSAVEHLLYTQGVTGSNPVPRTIDMTPFFKRKKRVLLLDDDPSMQRLVSTLLRREGFRVDSFLTGRDAILAIDSSGYDVLLLDLMMPHEGGMTVIRHLRSKNPDMLKKVVLLTGSTDAVIESVSEGVAGVVQKPFEAPDLVSAVERVSEKR